MGLKCTNYFDNSEYDSPNIQIITCKSCSSHLCLSDLILSDNFNGSTGPAYLVDNLINIEINPCVEDTRMKTGLYKINKIKCHQCFLNLGWFYKKSYSYSETYKEGKFVIEKSFIKFSENLSTTQKLTEKVKQNKFKRRFSSNSTTSSNNSSFNDDSLDLIEKGNNITEVIEDDQDDEEDEENNIPQNGIERFKNIMNDVKYDIGGRNIINNNNNSLGNVIYFGNNTSNNGNNDDKNKFNIRSNSINDDIGTSNSNII
ncbi:uncharacterized protein KGF55_000990 [Candida pseudojiufengensis]|uniref:uncharacterized protein n=1 Tax=Candida pseudojiufengensis TaxID=497109 RepID=UPI002224BBF0|nr:uncharacterized protein KGF55_000990 [Candida pseudojiufengensis]KAI5965628.1 hypothetical protein KGF55_000990 [Candida pseudojiufengensis]